jgi:hypothetical protein
MTIIWIFLAASALIALGYRIGAKVASAKIEQQTEAFRKLYRQLLEVTAQQKRKAVEPTAPVTASEGRGRMTADDWRKVCTIHPKDGNA